MVRHTTAALCARHASSVTFWVALTLALALAALHPAMIWANGGTGITILQPAGGVYMSGTNLTVSFNTDAALYTPFSIVAATPTPLPSLTPSPVPTPAASQAHQVPSRPSVSGGVIAAAAAGTLLALSLALLTVPPLRRRRNRPPR